MAFLDHNGESEFPFSRDQVFEAICRAVPVIKGMKIDYADKLQGRIMVKAGVSLFSWGENIPIQLTSVTDNKTKVQITSSPKTGIMLGGAFDMGKNRKNIETILTTTSRILSSQKSQTVKTETSQQSNFNQPSNFQLNQNSKTREQFAKKEKPWYKKTWVIILGVIILLVIIVNITSKNNSDKTTPSSSTETANPVKEKQWTEVYTFKGNGMKKSPVFELTGGDAKLKYKYKAPGGIGMGIFSVYVLNEGEDVMKTGGFPEVMTQAENEESESAIQKSSGQYYLYVNASGNWTVTVEEKK